MAAQLSASSISIKEQFVLEATPDVALVKLHVVGEGMLMHDAVENAQRKVAELSASLQESHPQIQRIDVFNVYFGQKGDRIRSEPQSFARPLVVQGILLTVRPEDSTALYRMLDDGIKRGALMDNPSRRSYTVSVLDSALLFGLVASVQYENQAIERCLKQAEIRCRSVAALTGKRIGRLADVFNIQIEPSMSDPFQKDYAHIRRSFPTRFLSPTPNKVLLCASLTAKYEMVDCELG